MRTFISVELPEEVKKNIAELTSELKNTGAAVKWVEPKNLHITMKFLGWVDDKNLDNLIELTGQAVAGTGSFEAKFSGMGTFPENKSPRVVWVGTGKGGDKLCNMAKALEKVLSKAGFKKEEREFKPHITIGRIKEQKGVDQLREKIKGLKDPQFGAGIVDRVNIMKSTLTSNGPIYKNIMEVKL